MKRIILLDAGPLGLLAYSRAISIAVQCNQWVQAMLSAGNEIVVPEIADYEVRRELVRGGLINGILRLEAGDWQTIVH